MSLNRETNCRRTARFIADDLPPARRLHAHVSIDWFSQQRFWFKPDAYGRIHTNATNLKKELRPTLHFGNGEPLVELDICCSQPTLLYGLLSPAERQRPDALEYLALCRSGELYTALAGHMSRKAAKGAFFHYLYSWQERRDVAQLRRHRDEKKEQARLVREAITRAMAVRFPTVSNYILRSKRVFGHRRFNHQMQRLESRLLIDGVCGRLLRDIPNTSILTIHDSLLTEEPTANPVQLTIRQILEQAGIIATIDKTHHERRTEHTTPPATPTPI